MPSEYFLRKEQTKLSATLIGSSQATTIIFNSDYISGGF
jgi:hypothetical protein